MATVKPRPYNFKTVSPPPGWGTETRGETIDTGTTVAKRGILGYDLLESTRRTLGFTPFMLGPHSTDEGGRPGHGNTFPFFTEGAQDEKAPGNAGQNPILPGPGEIPEKLPNCPRSS